MGVNSQYLLWKMLGAQYCKTTRPALGDQMQYSLNVVRIFHLIMGIQWGHLGLVKFRIGSLARLNEWGSESVILIC